MPWTKQFASTSFTRKEYVIIHTSGFVSFLVIAAVFSYLSYRPLMLYLHVSPSGAVKYFLSSRSYDQVSNVLSRGYFCRDALSTSDLPVDPECMARGTTLSSSVGSSVTHCWCIPYIGKWDIMCLKPGERKSYRLSALLKPKSILGI